MRRVCRLGLVILTLVSCTGCDQATKSMAREWLAPSPPISVLNDSIRFEYVENQGALLGLGSNMPREVRFVLFVILASASLVLTLALIARVRSLGLRPLIGLSLVAGGGMGNLIDRIFNNGTVVDFVRFGIGCVRTGVFNLADVAIMVGIVMLLVSSARGMKETGNAA